MYPQGRRKELWRSSKIWDARNPEDLRDIWVERQYLINLNTWFIIISLYLLSDVDAGLSWSYQPDFVTKALSSPKGDLHHSNHDLVHSFYSPCHLGFKVYSSSINEHLLAQVAVLRVHASSTERKAVDEFEKGRKSQNEMLSPFPCILDLRSSCGSSWSTR